MSASKLASTVGLNCLYDVAMHVEVIDGLLHGKDGVVLVLQEVYEAPSARFVDDRHVI